VQITDRILEYSICGFVCIYIYRVSCKFNKKFGHAVSKIYIAVLVWCCWEYFICWFVCIYAMFYGIFVQFHMCSRIDWIDLTACIWIRAWWVAKPNIHHGFIWSIVIILNILSVNYTCHWFWVFYLLSKKFEYSICWILNIHRCIDVEKNMVSLGKWSNCLINMVDSPHLC
jgi:hypothetical protein